VRRLTKRQRVAAIVLAALALCFLTLDLGGSGLRSAHGGVRGMLGSLYRGTDSVLGPVRRFVQGIPHAGSDEHELHALQKQNAALKKQLADARIDRSTAAQLRRLHLAAADAGYSVLPARVIATSAGQGFDYTVTLDAGSDSGVRTGQTVTDGAALVGRVLHADASTCVVLLAIDPGSGVGVRDLRTGQLGVATGAGDGGYSFRPLDPTAHIAVGDALSTGPAGASSFVAGLSVGRVRSVRVSADGTTVAGVDPAVSATGLDLVGIVRDGAQQDRTRTALGRSGAAGGR
jgi:rod shape-determining protein MreC